MTMETAVACLLLLQVVKLTSSPLAPVQELRPHMLGAVQQVPVHAVTLLLSLIVCAAVCRLSS
jgi:hypothetical protein